MFVPTKDPFNQRSNVEIGVSHPISCYCKGSFTQAMITALSLTKMRATDTTGRLSLAPWELQLLIGSFLSVVMMPKEPRKVNLLPQSLAFLPMIMP